MASIVVVDCSYIIIFSQCALKDPDQPSQSSSNGQYLIAQSVIFLLNRHSKVGDVVEIILMRIPELYNATCLIWFISLDLVPEC